MNDKEAKAKCLAFLRSAHLCYTQLKAGTGNTAYLAGRGLAFIQAFRHLAPAIGLETKGNAVLADLDKLIRKYSDVYTNPETPKNTEKVHVLTPSGVVTKLEEVTSPVATVEKDVAECLVRRGASEVKKLPEVTIELDKEPPVHERKDLPNYQAIRLGTIRDALRKRGYSEKAAYVCAFNVYKHPGTIEELIQKAMS